jgi:hypothetical protein
LLKNPHSLVDSDDYQKKNFSMVLRRKKPLEVIKGSGGKSIFSSYKLGVLKQQNFVLSQEARSPKSR